MMSKGRISVQGVDPEVIEQFKNMVENRYGKLHTVYAQEIERAMLQYMQTRQNPNSTGLTHGIERTHTQKPNVQKSSKNEPKKSNFVKKTDELVYIMQSKCAWDCEEFPHPVAEKMIRSKIGADPRTVNKYLAELENRWLTSRSI